MTPSNISNIIFPDSPFPKGFFQFRFLFIILLTQSKILWGLVPANTLLFTFKVSGLSVLSLKVTQGTFKIQDSS